jgi:hypothetical protein
VATGSCVSVVRASKLATSPSRLTAATTTSLINFSFQWDGNLVVYPATGPALWASGTWGHPDDGNVVIYLPNGVAIWDTGTRR